MPLGTQTHNTPAYTQRTIETDAPTQLPSAYSSGYSAADLSQFPAGGVRNTNTIEELRKNFNQLAFDFNAQIASNQAQITKNDSDIAEIDVNLTEHATDLSAIATDLANKAWDTITIVPGTGLSTSHGTSDEATMISGSPTGVNLQSDLQIDLDVAEDSEIGGILSNDAQSFNADGTVPNSSPNRGHISVDNSGQVFVKDHSLELGVKTFGSFIKTITAVSGDGLYVNNGNVNNGGDAEIGLATLIPEVTNSFFQSNGATTTNGITTVPVPRITVNEFGQLIDSPSYMDVNSANNPTITVTGGNQIDVTNGSLTLNQSAALEITIDHEAGSLSPGGRPVGSTITYNTPTAQNADGKDGLYHRQVNILDSIDLDSGGHVSAITARPITYGLNSPMSEVGNSQYAGGQSFDLHVPREKDFLILRNKVTTLEGTQLTIGDSPGFPVNINRTVQISQDLNVDGHFKVDAAHASEALFFVDEVNHKVGVGVGDSPSSAGGGPQSMFHVGGDITGDSNLRLFGADIDLNSSPRRTLTSAAGTAINPNSGSDRRRALVHEFNDKLTINYSNDYTGGVAIGNNVTIDNSGNIVTSGNFTTSDIDIKGETPMLKLWDTSSSPTGGDSTTTGYNQTTLATGNNHSFEIQTRDGDGTFVSNDYRITKDSNGATAHQFRVGGTNKLSINNTQVDITTSLDVTGGVGIGGTTTLGNGTGDSTTVSGDFTAGNAGAGNANKLFFDTSQGRFSVGNGASATSYDVGFKNASIFIHDGTIGNFGTNTAAKLHLKSGILSPTDEGANIELNSATISDTPKRTNAYYNAGAHIFGDPSGDSPNQYLFVKPADSFVGIGASTPDSAETIDSRTYGPYRFQVEGDTKLDGNVNVTGNLNVAGISSTGSSATVDFNEVDLESVGDISMDGVFSNSLATDASSSSDGGANTLSGGLAVGLKLFVGTNLDVGLATTIGGNLTANGSATLGNAASDSHLLLGSTELRGDVTVGSNCPADENLIKFNGTSGDVSNGPHTVIAERIYSGSERSELLLFKGNDHGTTSGPDRIRYRAAEHVFQTYNDSPERYDELEDNGSRVVISPGGFVGIGTDSPSKPLHVKTSSNTRIAIQTGSANAETGIDFGDSADNDVGRITYSHSNNYMSFFTQETNRMVIADDGDVGIGNTNPGYKLDVSGTIRANNVIYSTGTSSKFSAEYDSNKKMQLYHGSVYGVVGTSTNTAVGIRTNDTDRIHIEAGGNIGIGNSSPGSKLDVTGTITATEFSGSGASLTSIPAAQLSGTIDKDRLPAAATTITSLGTLSSLSSGLLTLNRGSNGDLIHFKRGNTTLAEMYVNNTATSDTRFAIYTKGAGSANMRPRLRFAATGLATFTCGLVVEQKVQSLSRTSNNTDFNPDSSLTLRSDDDHIHFNSAGSSDVIASIKMDAATGLEISSTTNVQAAQKIRLRPTDSDTVVLSEDKTTFFEPIEVQDTTDGTQNGGSIHTDGGISANGDLYIGSGATPALFVDDGLSKVGVGTSTPTGNLEVSSSSFTTITARTTGASSDAKLQLVTHDNASSDSPSTDDGWTLRNDKSASDVLDFRYDNSSKLQITSDGVANFKRVQKNDLEIINTGTSGSFDVDLTLSNVFVINVEGNTSMNLQNIASVAGASYTFIIKNTGAFDINFPSTMLFAGGDPVITAGNGKRDILSGLCDGTNIYAAFTFNLEAS